MAWIDIICNWQQSMKSFKATSQADEIGGSWPPIAYFQTEREKEGSIWVDVEFQCCASH
jgi:hypothetical protein